MADVKDAVRRNGWFPRSGIGLPGMDWSSLGEKHHPEGSLSPIVRLHPRWRKGMPSATRILTGLCLWVSCSTAFAQSSLPASSAAVEPDSGRASSIWDNSRAQSGVGQFAQQAAGDPQAGVNEILNQSLGSVDECYRGMHSYFNDDIVGYLASAGFSAVIKVLVQPGGVCDQLKRYSDLPVSFSLSFGPLSVSLDKLCPFLQRPACERLP